MNFRQKITLYLLLSIVLGSVAFAQVVDIPDLNLRAAIQDALNLPTGAPITQEDMRRLNELNAVNTGISDLTGLEYAMNLNSMSLWGNPFGDLTPLANLERLHYLDIAACSISDITALSNLVNLSNLNARYNLIADIGPLAHLTNLVELRLDRNRITDVTPLANLTHLEFLEIQNNQIADHSPLDALLLSHFNYDQTCDIQPIPLEPRVNDRNYPSILARWIGKGGLPSINRPDLSKAENIAQHDLWFGAEFGLTFFETLNGFTLRGDLDEAMRKRDELLSFNPNFVVLFDVGMRAAPLHFFPEDWPYWIRDAQGAIFREVSQGVVADHGLIDFTHPAVQDMIAQQAVAVAKCGLFDGIFFDYWSDQWPVLKGSDGTTDFIFHGLEAEQRARDNILRGIRANTRPNFLIMGNTNDQIIPRTGPHMNGGFMETSVPESKSGVELEESVARVENSLLWLEQNLRKPHINALEGNAIPTEMLDSPINLRWMRAITTLSLTHSDGYVVYTSPLHGHNHYWYDFWDADLGRPVGLKAQLYDEDVSGLYIREYTNGWAVYNHSGEAQVSYCRMRRRAWLAGW